MGVTMAPSSITQSLGTVRVTETSATPPGTYTIQATGTTAAFVDFVEVFKVTVTAPAPPPPPPPVSTVACIAIEPRDAEITAPATQQYVVALYDAAGTRMQVEAGERSCTPHRCRPSRIESATGLAAGANADVTTITA